jgi:hypothetical protein
MYIDPGTLMPVASALAAILGALLMFWRRVVHLVRTAFRAITSKFSRSAS